MHIARVMEGIADNRTQVRNTRAYLLASLFNSVLKLLFFLLSFSYCAIKVFFANIKRGGILLIQIAVGSLYMFSVPRGYIWTFPLCCPPTGIR